IIVGPGIQPGNPVLDLAQRGQHQDRHGLTIAAQPLEHAQSIEIGQHPIKNHNIPCLAQAKTQGLGAACGRDDNMRHFAEGTLDKLAHVHVILGKQNAHRNGMKKHPVRTALRLAFALALSAAPALQAREKPQPADVLIWPQARRAVEFRQMEKVFPHARVVRSSHPAPLLRGDPIAPRIMLDGQFVPVEQFMARDQSVGLLVLQNGRIRLEAYADGFRPGDHWAGFSLTKSVSSALIVAAIRDGRIGGLDDAVTHYLPGLTGSAYDGVKLRHLLSMTSGAAWSENYLDPASDVARMYSTPADPGFDPIVSYMRHLKRASPPGSQWLYKTGETDLVGMLLIQATGEPLANYLSRRIWQKIGMESDGWW
ncbi:hypothetical protein E4T56_gene8551, partial [Termitomyces sp. T112]